MKKFVIPIFILTFFAGTAANAQGRIYGRGRRFGGPSLRERMQERNLPKFVPSVNFSIGYGFPNSDKNLLPEFYNYYKGNVSQSAPITGALDYRFSRNMSIGVMVTHG